MDILIIEENTAEAEHLKHILEQHDYRVSIENDGKSALVSARQNKPPIVISAVLFAGMDGYALCREIKTDEELKDISVILLTSLSDATDIIRGMECGADNFITKPYDEELLISRVKFILLNRELRGGAAAQVGVEVIFHNEKYSVTPERQQMVDLLISTFETAVQKNIELTRVQTELNRLNNSLEEKVAERTAQLTAEIIERQTAEESLKEQQEFLRDVINANPNPIFVKDREGRFTLVNQAMATLCGTTTTAIIGKTDYDLNGKKAEVERILFQDKQVIETARSIHIPEEEFTHQKTGEVRWFQTNRMPLAETNGKAQRLLGVAVDITERKQTEEKLRDSELWLRAILDGSRDGILIEDDGEIIYVNEAYTKFLQYEKPEDLIGKDISFVLPPDENERMMEYGRLRLLGEQVPSVYKFKGKRKDGTLVDVEGAVSISVIGGKKYIMTAIRDITERKLAEESLENSERQYRFLSEGIMHQVWTAQPDGSLDYVNGRALEYFGLTFEQMINAGWRAFIHPNDAAEFLERWKKSVNTGEYFQVELRLKKVDGDYCWHLARATPGRDSDGKIVRWFGTNTDINDKKLAEEALKVARLQLETALNAGAIATWNYDILNNRIFADKNMAQLYCVSPEDAVGGSAEIYLRPIHSDDRQMVEEDLAKAISSGNTYEMNYRIVKSDGTIRWVEARGRIERDAAGTAISMPGVVIDITERKLAEQTLIESEERLMQSQKMEAIGTLTGGVAHDFNNLLTAILGNTQLAERNLAPDDPIRLRLTEVANAGNRAVELTRKLLAFSRRQHLKRLSLNLNDAIGEIIKLLERIIGEDVEILVKNAANLPAVFADPGQLEHVVMNLAINARDAMPGGGQITIETDAVELDEDYCRQYPYVVPGKYAQIKVSDSGSGMDEETKARIFEPFFTTKEVGKGTGLGLSMAYGIVKQHEGHIHVYSELGKGTTFKVYLPAYKKAVEEKTSAIPQSFLGGSETILVAEDEESLRNLAKDTLEELGYTVLLAKDGKEAVEIFAANRERVDLFLSDVLMPQMGGSEAYERIREMVKRNVPLIFMTGYSSETVQSRFVKSRVTAERLSAVVIQKPYSLEELGRIVREVLDKNR